MIRKFLGVFICILTAFSCSFSTMAHPGRLDANGGHYNRKTGEYHYHRGNGTSSSSTSSSSSSYSGSSSSSSDDTYTPSVPETVYATKVEVSNMPDSMFVGDSVQLKAVVSPSDAVDKDITWASSDVSVATIDANGNLAAIKVGTTSISATTANGATYKHNLTVKEVVAQKIAITNKKTDIIIGQTAQFSATISPENATNKDIKWESENSAVATIDANGNLTAVGVGKTKIFAKHGELSDSFELNVKPIEAESVKISLYDPSTSEELEEYRLKVGEELSFDALVLPADTTDSSVKWSVSDSNLAEINNVTNKLVALDAGTITLTATTTNNKTDSVTIEIYKKSFISVILTTLLEIGVIVLIFYILSSYIKKKRNKNVDSNDTISDLDNTTTDNTK